MFMVSILIFIGAIILFLAMSLNRLNRTMYPNLPIFYGNGTTNVLQTDYPSYSLLMDHPVVLIPRRKNKNEHKNTSSRRSRERRAPIIGKKSSRREKSSTTFRPLEGRGGRNNLRFPRTERENPICAR